MASGPIIIGAAFIFGAIIILIAIAAGLITLIELPILGVAAIILLPMGVVFLFLGLALAGKFAWGLKHTREGKK